MDARSAVREAVAWCGAVSYPVALWVAVLNWPPDRGGVRLILPAILAVLPIDLLRRRPLAALVLMLAGSFLAVTTTGANPGLGYLLVVVNSLAVGFITGTRPLRTAIVAAGLALATQIAAATYWSTEYMTTVTLVVLAAFAAGMVGYTVAERRRHLETVREQATAQAVTAERLRIARELHDMIAHSIGVIAIQAGVGRRVIDTKPTESRDALAAIEATSRDTLAGLRTMLGTLREDSPPGLPDVNSLAERTRDAGVNVAVQWRGEPRPLPIKIELSAYRIIQEAITNVVRHAGTHECRVAIGYQDEALSTEIVDDGRGANTAVAGFGLTGIRERVTLLHGEFTAQSRAEGGFRVAVRLPVPARVR
jgi:signal transduction histidine kinase